MKLLLVHGANGRFNDELVRQRLVTALNLPDATVSFFCYTDTLRNNALLVNRLPNPLFKLTNRWAERFTLDDEVADVKRFMLSRAARAAATANLRLKVEDEKPDWVLCHSLGCAVYAMAFRDIDAHHHVAWLGSPMGLPPLRLAAGSFKAGSKVGGRGMVICAPNDPVTIAALSKRPERWRGIKKGNGHSFAMYLQVWKEIAGVSHD